MFELMPFPNPGAFVLLLCNLFVIIFMVTALVVASNAVRWFLGGKAEKAEDEAKNLMETKRRIYSFGALKGVDPVYTEQKAQELNGVQEQKHLNTRFADYQTSIYASEIEAKSNLNIGKILASAFYTVAEAEITGDITATEANSLREQLKVATTPYEVDTVLASIQ